MGMYKVIIVDDEKLLRQGFIHMTNWSEYDIHIVGEASNGQEALELIEQTDPDIVITDIKMPVMDGIELTCIIKQKYPHIQIVILSSYDDFDYVRETLKLGALDYILKAQMEYTELLNILGKAKELITDHTQPVPPPYSTEEIITPEIDYMHLGTLIEKLAFHEIGTWMERFIIQNTTLSSHVLNRVCIDIFYYIMHKLDELGLCLQEINQKKYIYFNDIENAHSCEELVSIFNNVLHTIQQHITDAKQHHYGATVKACIAFIHENYQNNISLSSASRYLHVNKSYLCELFKQQIGENFNDYLCKLRIEKAKEFLRKSGHTIYTVGSLVGYSNPSYFGKVFKNIVGITPSEYSKIYHK